MGQAASKQEAFWEACGFGHADKVAKFLSDGDIDVNWVSYTVAGNDITATSTVEGLLEGIDRLICRIMDKPDPPTVIIGSIFYRYRPRGMTVAAYNEMVEHFNAALERIYHQHPKVHFWSLRGLRRLQRVDYIDGVHLNRRMAERFARQHDCCPIHVASQGKPTIVQMLLDAKCNVNVKDNRGNLPIHHAAMKGHSDIMKTLIDAGSEINTQDKNGWTPLHCAAYWGHLEAVKVLVKRGAEVNTKNKDERTALHETARSQDYHEERLGDIATILIAAGSDVNAKSSDLGEADFTGLMFAAYHNHPEVAVAFTTSGCDINAYGTNGWTALHWAVDRDNEEMVYVLLEEGVDPTKRAVRGELASDRTSRQDIKDVLMNAVNMFNELSLLEGGGKPKTTDMMERPTNQERNTRDVARSEEKSPDTKVRKVESSEKKTVVSSDITDCGNETTEKENESAIQKVPASVDLRNCEGKGDNSCDPVPNLLELSLEKILDQTEKLDISKEDE